MSAVNGSEEAIRRDSGGKRISALDIAVLLVILALAVFAFLRSGIVGNLLFSGQEYNVRFITGEVNHGFSDNFSVGDSVFFEDGSIMGRIVSVEESAAYIGDGNGSGVQYPSGTVVRLTVTVRAELSWTDGRFISRGGDRVTPGDGLKLFSQRAFLDATVLSVSELSD